MQEAEKDQDLATQAMVGQCQLPGRQYKLIDGVGKLPDLASLTVIDEDPETRKPVAEITAIRQANPVLTIRCCRIQSLMVQRWFCKLH